MIQNERQYQVTQEQAARLEQALHALRTDPAGRPHIHPRLQEAERHAIEDLLEGAYGQIAEYEAIISGERTVVFAETLEELPAALIKARAVVGISDAEIAKQLGLTVAAYRELERDSFANASFDTVLLIARILGVSAREPIVLGFPVSVAWRQEQEERLRKTLRHPAERAAALLNKKSSTIVPTSE